VDFAIRLTPFLPIPAKPIHTNHTARATSSHKRHKKHKMPTTYANLHSQRFSDS